MTDRPVRFEHLAQRFGPTYKKRIYGSPLEPWVEARADVPAHRSWFVGGQGGEVGALWCEGELFLAVGRDGAGWQLEGGSVATLHFEPGAPEILQREPADLHANIHTVLFERRQPLADLSYCRVTPKPGQRFLLSSGLSIEISGLDVSETNAELFRSIANSQPEPERGFLARILGSSPGQPAGAALIIGCLPDEPPPAGFLPWLEHYRERGVRFNWMGNEGGGGLHTCEELGPVDDVERALLSVLEQSPEVREGIFEDAWEEWGEYGVDEPGFERLVEDAPERGFWRRLELDEIARNLSGRASEYLDSGTSDARLLFERHVPGAMLVEHMKAALVEPVVMALHQVPSDESVVVWFAIGGVSKSTGDLEVMLVERVWS
ncbi:MAG TPA: hypothetical protein ENK57_21300 [Polyangiaceae bacterium]|nr:hypothetical protein [Polyangiaceae bacterium]